VAQRHTEPVKKGQNNSASKLSCSTAKFIQKFNITIRCCSVCQSCSFWNL